MVWPYHLSMATMTIRGTYALDVGTVRRLEDLARRWGVSKSEALRRAIRGASDTDRLSETGLEVLDALQRTTGLTRRRVDEWVATVWTERRRASSRRVRR